MVFYLFVSAILLVSSYYLKFIVSYKKRLSFQAIWGGSILFFFSAFRAPFVGVDTPQYVEAYKHIANMDWGSVIAGTQFGSFEIGFRLLNKGFSLISTSEHFFILWTTLLAFVPVVFFVYKYSTSPILSYMLYIFSGQYFYEIGVIRQSISFGVALIAIMVMIDGNKWWFIKAIILVGIASLIHTAALVVLIFIALADVKKIGTKYYLMGIILILVLIVFRQRFVGLIVNQYSSYSVYSNLGGGIGRIIIVSAIFFFFLMYKRLIYANDSQAIFWEKMISIIFLLKVFSYFFAAASRASAIYEMSYIIAIPNTLSVINKRDRVILSSMILGLFVLLECMGFDGRDNYFFWAKGA